MSKLKMKPVTAALGAAFLASAIAPAASADVNPFSATPLNAGYDIVNAGGHGAKDGEGKCGEGKCGEGKCGEGKCGGESKGEEGKCGEGKCGEDKCGEGKCGGDHDKGAEGTCGEGKCGG